ncbi:1-(5-phosphoribosyl)-5-[(5-phosphoribosylamino)methylideneamino]imidazole-4-carboxamide isomerase [Kiloniella laminariae]|uniref:1-(5-phosphoribosyl)-5-[(5-phosphoribosylamino)methylideneamino] imidazole-4-carboxamide isomerase n=1 Tax=Kiloniella laminariae TaxID=454162 RepID=A0ABT4LJC2_9PROT|nr:1-(5-phosphoribosyl)-5-[(5-phosphoribosylamino)methylideneamino]imidazole-4-carboxamide isomerase [Kiloniella laminariae]MCZ4281209.1 1-(5-phosphoribosyl)-5-[(5-phosphoribosylamino)methylideneamino]imidazole-4-carboxamide isomerase [Kiloniella laminariae]
MIVFPAIDLKDGEAVRLLKGEMNTATVFNSNPAAQAKEFEDAGFQFLHMVDLNGAFEGRPVNRAAVEKIVATVSMPTQLGGGIRDLKTIEQWLEAGVSRVILGTVAVKNPALVIEACKTFPGKIVVGIDARGGMVATEGWAETSDLEATELARKFENAGVSAIVYTDIDRDGLLQGCNVEATANLARAISIPVIASGGVASVEDIRQLKAVEDTGIEGVICGRSIYDGRIDPKEALLIANGSTPAGSAA